MRPLDLTAAYQPGDRVLYWIPGEHPEDVVRGTVIGRSAASFRAYEIDTKYGGMTVPEQHLTLDLETDR